MLFVIAQALFFFLPAYVANATPVALTRFKIVEFLNKPIDGGAKLWGQPVLGSTKTWRGMIVGMLAGVIVVALQALAYDRWLTLRQFFLYEYYLWDILFLGFLLGFGILLGDLIKSFLKRRAGVQSSASFFPFDYLDFLGALFLSQIFFPLPWQHVVVILVISPLLSIVANIIGCRLGWKKIWW